MNLIYDHYFTEVDDIDLLLQEVILENYNIHTIDYSRINALGARLTPSEHRS